MSVIEVDDNDQTIWELGDDLDGAADSLSDILDGFSEDGGGVMGALDDALSEIGPASSSTAANRVSSSATPQNAEQHDPNRVSETSETTGTDEGEYKE